jgi:2-iminobutanoate/2-iminopropanoate deaminase
MDFISSDKVPVPGGHYSQAVHANGVVYVSGVLPGDSIKEDFEAQLREVLTRCTHVLEAAGCSLNDVAQCTGYIVGTANWPHFNRIYAEVFGDHRPARAVVPVPELHYGALVEVQMIAHRP